MNHLVAIIGPTASSKSELALHLALTFNGEIVGADSRQVYRYLDIGIAKPTIEQRALVPHHLIDMIDPNQDFTLAQYQELAYQAIDDIQQRDKLPFLVGGSGLYVWSIIEGWKIPRVPPNKGLRQQLEERATKEGVKVLYDELCKIDPRGAQRINPRNLRRTIRALEVCKITGELFSRLQGKSPPSFKTLIIGLTTERTELYRRIDLRVDGMIERGLITETQDLMRKGYGLDLPSMTGLGYRQIAMFLRGEMDLPTAIQRIKSETHRFVRHQYAWFRLDDKRIQWFDIREQFRGATTVFVREFVTEGMLMDEEI